MKYKIYNPSKCRSRAQYINISIQPLYLFVIFTVNYPSFPFVAEDKDVGTEVTGLIFASWSFPAFIIPFILPQLLGCIGKRRLFIASLVIAALSTGATGLISLFDYAAFLILAFGFRILQGAMAAIMNPMYFSLGAELYPKTKDNVYALQVLTTLCGIGAGPLIGAPLYKALGFDIVQYFIGLIGMVIFLPLAIFGIPSYVDQKRKKRVDRIQNDSLQADEPLFMQKDQQHYETLPTAARIADNDNASERKQIVSIQDSYQNCKQSTVLPPSKHNYTRKNSISQASDFYQRTLTFGSFLKRPRIIAGMIVGFSSIMTQVYFTPYLSKQLKYRYGIQEQYHGLYYGIRAFSSAIVAIASPCLSKKLGRSNSIWAFYLLILIAHVFFAQSWVLGLPQDIQFIVIGLFLMGLSQSQMYVPVVPDLTQYMIEEYKQKQLKERGILSCQQIEVPEQYTQRSVQVISSLFVFAFGVSQVVGPMMGAALYEYIGYRKAGDAQNLLLLIFFIYYSIFGGVTWLRCKKKKRHY